jgi:hypothetical protein
MTADDHDKLTKIGVDVAYIKDSVDKLTLFMGEAPCTENSNKIKRIDDHLTWGVRAVLLSWLGTVSSIAIAAYAFFKAAPK